MRSVDICEKMVLLLQRSEQRIDETNKMIGCMSSSVATLSDATARMQDVCTDLSSTFRGECASFHEHIKHLEHQVEITSSQMSKILDVCANKDRQIERLMSIVETMRFIGNGNEI